MTALFALSHVAAFIFGAVMWHFITIREGTALGEDGWVRRRSKGHTPTLILVSLLASMTIIGFGIQQVVFQAQHEDRMDCIEVWGHDVVKIAEVRQNTLKSLGEAEQRRTNAVDRILMIYSNLTQRSGPDIEQAPTKMQTRFYKALEDFEAAKLQLERERVKANTRRENNPYPPLNCE